MWQNAQFRSSGRLMGLGAHQPGRFSDARRQGFVYTMVSTASLRKYRCVPLVFWN